MTDFDKLDPSHRDTYQGFGSFTKWGIIVVCLVLLGMFAFLVKH